MKRIILFIFILVFTSTLISTGLYIKNPTDMERRIYDLVHKQADIHSFKEAKRILTEYDIVSFHQLPKDVLIDTKLDDTRFSKLTFYKIPKRDLYRKIYLNQRITDFYSLPQNQKFILFFGKEYYYICLNEKVLKSLFDLKDVLEVNGYNSRGIQVISGYRHPSRNDAVGGATNSMHLYGNALDIRVGDINRDTKADTLDKELVYSILNNTLIGNKGGLGFYPGTMVLHMDVRGTRARWDTYKRKI
ncbi:MAG: YcbK family protein [Sphingobacteriales bacterium]|jgi:hypothetical protein